MPPHIRPSVHGTGDTTIPVKESRDLTRRMDELDREMAREEFDPGHLEHRAQMKERDMWSARLLDLTATLDALAARRAAAEAKKAEEAKRKAAEEAKRKAAAEAAAKKAEAEVIEKLLDELGESTSGLKDFAMKAAGNISAMMSSGADDEIHKNSLALSGLTQFSISSLESLITIGTAADLPDAVKQLQTCLSEERSMAAWLAGNLRGLVVMHLQRRTEGLPAKR